MRNKGYDLIREQVFSEKLENGLSVFVIPKRGYNKSYAFFATDYGGADRRFKLGGNWIDTPMGVAHFLEHKMFDTKDGNALTDLSANGASPNAFTSSDITAYHFESTEKFEENLEILLSFVSIPYFTPESVQKEQGIIGQEIRMTEDEPDYAVYYGLMKALYKHNPLRDSVAGTVESIAQITADTLYNCHNVFYNPSNMVLCVTGDVDPEKIVAAARRILPKEPGEVPQRDYGPAESQVPETKRAEQKMEVSIPIFLMGAKAVPVKDGRDYFRQELVGALALDILAGHSSPLYLQLYGQGLVNSGFSAAYESAAGAFYTMAGGESSDPDKVFKLYKAEAKRLADRGVDTTLFDRLKKAMTGRQIRMLNSFDSICYNYAQGYFRGYDAYEAVDILNAVTPEDVVSFIRTNLAPDNLALSIISPYQTA
ncbi:Predicted Zn-dependent peptidase [Sporobacter termitidis DSM 10068]|uniref:Predicted Zn-dependent peptidase n=1 Tax=Sporobacter termitidis DSM 10068 TaxID=1123282 RepID=A0A1M5TDS2_9FIRM|nr:pitrilysin family protein [Sporobacter termitidis]SHH48882.1 Predicted Zn-dependent peptidase [Sporobacter termitidis DSM 10068]